MAAKKAAIKSVKEAEPSHLFSYFPAGETPEPFANLETALDAAYETGDLSVSVYQYVGDYILNSKWEKIA